MDFSKPLHLWAVTNGLLIMRPVVPGSAQTIWLDEANVTKLSSIMRAPRIVGIDHSMLNMCLNHSLFC